jgi:4a-hydroxytetrahydrobiopterin dehydratase
MRSDLVLSRGQASELAPGWRYLLGRLHLTVNARGFAEALDVVSRIGAATAEHEPRPDVDIRDSRIHLSLGNSAGVTDRHVVVANAISVLLDALDLDLEPTRGTEVEIAIDAMDIAAIKPFWAAVLGYPDDREDDVVDPDRRGPNVWFQQMDEPRPQRNRMHIDVTVAHDQAAARLRAALAAGGRLVSDREAPSFWVLADAEGNEACICTWQNRD